MTNQLFQDNIESDLHCPFCRVRMIVKTNRKTQHQFLGCPNYPECTHTEAIPPAWVMRMLGQKELGLEAATDRITELRSTIKDLEQQRVELEREVRDARSIGLLRKKRNGQYWSTDGRRLVERYAQVQCDLQTAQRNLEFETHKNDHFEEIPF